ncbi:MAG TPA: hypothetical protein VFN13_02740 [Rudaea sp.]|nr:hypothetical protein [Rudaea sp.]
MSILEGAKRQEQSDEVGHMDGLVAECKTAADVEALYTRMLQRVINRSLAVEMDVHLACAPHAKGDGVSVATRATAQRRSR